MDVIKRGISYLKPYSLLAIGAFISVLIVTATNLYVPQLIQQLIDDGIEGQNWNGILWAAGGLLIMALVRGLFSFTNTYWSAESSQGIAFDLRNEIFEKLETLSFSYHDTHQTGQLMTRTTSDVESVRVFFSQGLLQLVSAVITFVGSIVILFITDWRLTLAVLTTIPLIIGIFIFLFSRMGPLFGQVQKMLGLLNNILQENIAGMRVVKSFTAEPFELNRYRAQNDLLYQKNLNVARYFSTGFPTVFLLSNLGTLIVIWYGGNLVISNELQLGQLIAFNSYLAYLLMPIFQLGGLSQQMASATASGKRLFEILDTENEIASPSNAIRLTPDMPGRVVFENVSFAYQGSDENVLSDISFDASPGHTIALLGATGSGKSSIVNLIPRFYDTTAGRILIDGNDVRQYDLDTLRQQVGSCLQEVTLRSGTIRENIVFGKPDATLEEVVEAAKIAQAHDFILQQPEGYETQVGERGSGLSGGQRQRVAIARVLLVNPSIIIFDDSMSALDAETEQKLKGALRPFLEKSTAIIIAQRIATVRSADQILVIDQGKIIGRGTHEELLEHSAIYNEIVSSQLEEEPA
ncbi:MAG: ATP-binding cassette subfamily B multidrug efflux pump [Cellvibrionaceae bacterium]|jgi:ATP-binding cassette subfamily B multidrug efflux pump